MRGVANGKPTAMKPIACVATLAAALALAGCGGQDEPVAGDAPERPLAGPYLESFTTLERELEAAGVDPRRTGPATALERRSLPRALRSETLETSRGTELSVLLYGAAQAAQAARSSVREATPGRFILEQVDNMLVVVGERAPDTPEVRGALRELERE